MQTLPPCGFGDTVHRLQVLECRPAGPRLGKDSAQVLPLKLAPFFLDEPGYHVGYFPVKPDTVLENWGQIVRHLEPAAVGRCCPLTGAWAASFGTCLCDLWLVPSGGQGALTVV